MSIFTALLMLSSLFTLKSCTSDDSEPGLSASSSATTESSSSAIVNAPQFEFNGK
ncbi:MAG: hypothetical protein ACEQSF_03210 [Solirubrobacteraceae bacterium]